MDELNAEQSAESEDPTEKLARAEADRTTTQMPLRESRLPATGPTATDEPGANWTVQQYTSFCVELELAGNQPQTVFTRYHLSDQGDAARAHQLWRRRMSQEPSLQQQWRELFAEYHRWAKRQKR